MSKVFTITEGLENLGALRTGGQGSVYKGRRMGPILTAIKLLPTPIHTESEDDKNFRNFKNEVAKLQKVNEQPNPNVVKIMSWGLTESGSFPFIEMEYIEGPDLCELLQPPHDKIFSLKEVIRLADQLSNALAHCHKVGVKHGDIKSNNVKYNVNSGNYVLLDFGLAIMTEEQRRTSIRHAGAIEFMAPEQHEGHMLPQTDVYSFAIILYELLTGEVPFPLHGNGETGRNAVMLAHMESEIPDLLMKRVERLPESWPVEKQKQEMQVPKWLLAVIDKCLQKDPAKRYASGMELHEAIINGSLAATERAVVNQQPQQADANVVALQAENQRLQSLVLQLEQAQGANVSSADDDDDGSTVTLSKPLFYIFMTLFILFIGFSVYSAFFMNRKSTGAALPDTTQTERPDTATVQAQSDRDEKPVVDPAVEKQRIADSVKASIQRTLEAEKAKQPKPDTTENLEPDTSIRPEP